MLLYGILVVLLTLRWLGSDSTSTAPRRPRRLPRYFSPQRPRGQKEFKVRIAGNGAIGTIVESTFNFSETSGRWIRKVFNTNPQLVNDSITTTANKEYYFLGETFERGVTDLLTYGTDDMFGCIVALSSSAGGNPNNFKTGFKMPQTPPIVAQDQNSNYALFDVNSTPKELFSIVARDQAEWAQNNLKISLLDIKQSPNPSFEPYGRFSLLVRDMMDTDANPVILEQYNNLSLNPNSPNYIGRRIGDKYVSWDTTNRKYREYGQYDNVSRYIRMDMDVSVDGGNVDPSLLPFGFKGVPKNIGFNFNSGSTTFRDLDLSSTDVLGSAFADAYAKGSGSVCSASFVAGATLTGYPIIDVGTGSADSSNRFLTASFAFPMLPLRHSSSDAR